MSDNEIKVLLTADLASLQEGMAAGTEAVQTNTEAMAAAVQEAAVSIQEAQAAVAESIGTATQALQASLEETAATITGTNRQTTESVAAEAAAFNAAVQAKIDAQVRLNAAFAGSIGSTAAIGEAEAALDQAMAVGAITASEYAAYIERLNLAEVEMAASAEAATVATEENTAAMVINGGVARELGVMLGELARGNYTRLEGSTITLANRTGSLSTALSALMSPIGLATVGAAALGYEVYAAGDGFRDMQGAVIATGGASGFVAGQLMQVAEAIGEATGDITGARETIEQLAASGRFAGEDLKLVGTAAAEMSAMTGQSISSIIAQIEKLQEDPLRAVAKLNDQFHFLTVAEFEQMEQLVKSGDKMEAARIAYEAMANTMSVRTEEVHQHVNVLISAFDKLKVAWSQSMEAANVALGGGDDQEKLNIQIELLDHLKRQRAEALADGSGALPGINAQLAAQQKVVDDLTAKFKKQADAAAEVGKAAQQSAAQIDAMAKAHPSEGHSGSSGRDKAQADRDQFNEQRLQHTMSLADERQFWEQKREAATAGTQAYRQAVQQILEIRQRQASEARAAARQEETDARQAAAAKVRAAREVAREETIAQQQQLRLSLEKLQASHDEANGEIETKRQQYRAEYADGQMSAQQLLDLERQLATQRLAIDTQYFQDKAKLEAKDQVAVVRDESAIVRAQQTMHQTMARAEQEFHANSQREWQAHARKIEGAMQTAINGMLFQHQTLRQGLASIALVIGEDFVQQAVMKPLDSWIMGEAAKTAAAVSGEAERNAIQAAGAVQSKTIDAATGKSQIGTAAATGAAKAYQAIVGIPYVGPVLAPIAAGVAFAGIEAFSGQIASARGGWERVPFDGAMTELHKDEMVLPKHIADPMRQMAQRGTSGGTGGGDHYHFHSFDSRGIADYARRRPNDLARAMKYVSRRGHL